MNDSIPTDEQVANGREMDERDACPQCGNYYCLSSSAPNMPQMLAAYGTDEQISQWEEEHNYNVLKCSVCGWSDDDE